MNKNNLSIILMAPLFVTTLVGFVGAFGSLVYMCWIVWPPLVLLPISLVLWVGGMVLYDPFADNPSPKKGKSR